MEKLFAVINSDASIFRKLLKSELSIYSQLLDLLIID